MLEQMIGICGVPLAFLLVRVALSSFLSTAVVFAAHNRISVVISSFSTTVMGVDLLFFCFLIDIIHLANFRNLVTADHLISQVRSVDASTIIVLIMLVHLTLVFFCAKRALTKIIKPELEEKSDLIRRLWMSRHLQAEPPDMFVQRVEQTTRGKLRHRYDSFGLLILLVTLVLLIGRVN